MSTEDRVTGLIGFAGCKVPVLCATTAAITLSGEQTIDGQLTAASRVLVKDQASSIDNGIYVSDSGAWSRAPDCDGPYDLRSGSLIPVFAGSVSGGAVYRCTTTGGDLDIGTDSLTFSAMGLFTAPMPVASGGTGAATAVAGLANLGVVQVTAEAGTNTITGTVDALVTALRADQLFIMVPLNANTGATTLELTPSGGASLTAKNVFWNGAACLGGELTAAVPVILQYDGTRYNIIGNAAFMPASFVNLRARGAIYGLTLSNNVADATNDIDIAAGGCMDSTGAFYIQIAASTKQLDANWAAGTTGGMRNSAAAIANGTYHIYAVATAAGVTGIYAYAGVAGTDPDSTATVAAVIAALQLETGGASYVYARRIGSILRESAAIVGFVQNGDEFLRKVPIVNVNTTNPGTSAVTATLSVPVGLTIDAVFSFLIYAGVASSAIAVLVTPLSITDTAPNTAGPLTVYSPDAGAFPASGVSELHVRTNTSSQIRYRLSASGASVVALVTTRGWIDSRGRNG